MSHIIITNVILFFIRFITYKAPLINAFIQHPPRTPNGLRPHHKLNNYDTTTIYIQIDKENPPCFYKNHENRWRQRVELKTLSIGQRLIGVAINGTELLEGKTGPKSK